MSLGWASATGRGPAGRTSASKAPRYPRVGEGGFECRRCGPVRCRMRRAVTLTVQDVGVWREGSGPGADVDQCSRMSFAAMHRLWSCAPAHPFNAVPLLLP